MTSPGDERERELAASRVVGRIPADTLSNRLTLARKMAGLTIREAAELCGYGRGAWTNWEKGARPLDLLEITGVIAEKLDVDLEWLRFGGPLASSRGVPVRPASDTVRYPERGLEVGVGYSTYLTPAVQPTPAQTHPSDTRPKRRVDRSGPVSPGVTGRRAALVR